jgi:hypothetical protein
MSRRQPETAILGAAPGLTAPRLRPLPSPPAPR